MIFKNVVNIDAHFQHSINIGLDLGDSEKVNSYILTSSGAQYFEYFIDNIIDNRNFSNMLIAPYGKGKSHAVLVLLTLLENCDYTKFDKLINKIKDYDIELYKKINEIKNKKFLPVLISNTRGSLSQSMLISMQKALDRANIKDLILDTDFTEAINRLEMWEKDYPNIYNDFCLKLNERKISFIKFNSELSNFNEEFLQIFKEIHKEILGGVEFFSQNTLEVVEYYQKILAALVNDYNYSGIYIIFDEFSKFLESRDEKYISNDMKIIQDLAELCNNSKGSQMHLQLVLHKPISDYLSMNKRIKNAFKGIEGRVNPYYFTTTLKSTFDLISNVIVKNNEYQKVKKDLVEKNKKILDDLKSIPIFDVEFDETYLKEKLLDACYPLHPLTNYLLIKINSKVAQNERTLFTFLAKDGKASLKQLIDSEYPSDLILADSVFDYFKKLFIDEKDDLFIKKTINMAISALSKVDDELERQFIKVLSLILITNEKDVLPTNESILSSCLMIDRDLCVDIINTLKDKGIIVERYGGKIEFKMNLELDLSQKVNDIKVTKYSKIDVVNELRTVVKQKYYYPRTYNIVHNVTRYFKIDYMLDKDFIRLSDLDFYFKNELNDGIIINIIRSEEDLLEEVKAATIRMNNNRVVVIYPNCYFDYTDVLRDVCAVNNLLQNEEFIESNPLVKNELEMILYDTKELINDKLDNDYSFTSVNNHIFTAYNHSDITNKKHVLSKNRILGEMLEQVFYKYPDSINLELLNKQNVSGGYRKARENIVDSLLNHTLTVDEFGKSPEDTITNCLLVETGIQFNEVVDDNMKEFLNVIYEFLQQNEGSFEDLYSKLMSPPYGVRKGVIPVYLSYVISKIRKNILIKCRGHEVDLDAKNIELINENPKNFTYFVDEVDADKTSYIEDLSRIFDVEISHNISKSYSKIFTAIRDWYVSLPKFTKQMIGVEKPIASRAYKLLRKELNSSNINASDFILEYLPKIIVHKNLSDVSNTLEEMKNQLNKFAYNYAMTLKKCINTELGFDEDTSILNSVKYWVDLNRSKINSIVLDDYIKQFIQSVDTLDNCSEVDVVNKIAYDFTSLFIEDWSELTKDLFIRQLNKLTQISAMNDISEIDSDTVTLVVNGQTITKKISEELDDSTELIENFIDGTMEDYGCSLSNEQKVALLLKIMKKYL